MKRLFVGGVLALSLFVSQPTHGDEKLDSNSPIVIKAKMVENYLAIREAYRSADSQFLISFESPEYTNVLCNSRIKNKSEADLTTRAMFSRIQKVYDANAEIKSLKITSHRVEVVSDLMINADILSPRHTVERVMLRSMTRDVWVRYADEWFLKRTENLTYSGSNGWASFEALGLADCRVLKLR